MQTKFASIKCSCEEKFDSQERIPMKLPCGHNLCYYCIIDQHREKKHIFCQQCQATHQINPRNFEQDDAFLETLEKLEKQQGSLENELGQIQKTQSQIKKLRQERKKHSSNASQRLIQKLLQVLWVLDFAIKEQFRQDELDTSNTSKTIQNIMNREESKLELATHQIIQEASSSSLKLEQNMQQEKELTLKAEKAINKLENEVNTILDEFQLNEIQKIFQTQEQKNNQQELEERVALQQQQEESLKAQQEKKRVQAQKLKQQKEQERKIQEEKQRLIKQKEAEKQKEIQNQQKQEQIQGCQVKSPWSGYKCRNESNYGPCPKCQKKGCQHCIIAYTRNCKTCNKKGKFCVPCYFECEGKGHQI